MFKIISSYSRVHRCFHSVGRAMSEPVPLILRLIAASIPIANHAGKIIRDVMKTGELKIVEKGIEDFQTKADRLAQQYIVTAISRQFPDVHIIGEEDGATEVLLPEVDIKDTFDQEVLQKNIPNELANVTQNQITVWVDPLDGTSEYTKGLLEHVTVLIGVSVDGQSVAGVVHQPYYGYKEKTECGRTLWGIPGLGIFGLDLKPPPTNKRIITTTRSHNNETVQKTIDSMKADEVIKVGGAGYKVILLLEGKAHAYVFASAGSKRWDTCAPEALLHAAGGLLTDVTGTLYKYDKEVDFVNRRGVLAVAKKEQHEEYLKLIPNDVKESFQK